MTSKNVHLIQILIRHRRGEDTVFLVHPHDSWFLPNSAGPYLVLPTKKTIGDIFAPFIRGTSLEAFVSEVMEGQLGLDPDDYALEEEISPVSVSMRAIHSGELKHFTVCPVDVWVAASAREPLRDRLQGEWFTPQEALAQKRLSPSARGVFEHVLQRERELDQRYAANPEEELRDETPNRLLRGVSERPSMYALACRWFSRNKQGVRYLSRDTLHEMLAAGRHAFNLRVADPYLHYQLQGVGFTWSFFTHKDKQEVHTHGAPSVEIYGVLEGRMEMWWKPYYDRGTSAWSHQILGPGDWIEVEALQCHIVHWLTPGKGVVFKAGPGPLAEVGRLGVKGKTPCEDKEKPCPCLKPPEIFEAPWVVQATPSGKPWGLSVRALIRDDQGRLLLLRRSAESRHFAGQWDLPGGKAESGEPFDIALAREVEEETGFSVVLKRTVGTADDEMPLVKVTNLFCEVTVTGGALRLNSENTEAKWATPEEVASADLARPIRDFLRGMV
jgi:8-oxo-dGTP diphosphatase